MSESLPNRTPLPSKRTRWISLPPVYRTTYDDFVPGIGWRKLKANVIKKYEGAGSTASKEEKATVTRLITEIESKGVNAKRTYLVFKLGFVRGAAVVDVREEAGYVTICYLLTDGSEWGIGVTLMEEAADLSEELGNGGKLRLIPDNDGLITYYEKLGFTITEPATMYSGAIMSLLPAAPIWGRVNQQWRIAANEPQATWR